MTIAPSLRPSPSAPDRVEWRELGRDLWAARRDGRPLGTVEHGRGYLATGSEAEPLGRYRTLEAAMDAVAHPEGHPALHRPVRRSWNGLVFVGTLSVAAGMLLAVYGLLGL